MSYMSSTQFTDVEAKAQREKMTGLNLHRCSRADSGFEQNTLLLNCRCFWTPALSCLLTFCNGRVGGTLCTLICTDPCFLTQAPTSSMQRELSTLGKLSWLPRALHVVYQLRSGERALALNAEGLIALADPVFLHAQETEDAAERGTDVSSQSLLTQDSTLSQELLSVWQRRGHLISAWEVMGWADGGSCLLFLDRNTNVSENGMEA